MTTLLVVAGHDSSGGAGVDADREAAEACGVRAACVVTAFTVQDARGLRELGAREAADWLEEALSVEQPSALKLGLLPGPEHVRAAARLAIGLRERFGEAFPIVLDPVIAASSGARFLDGEGVEALRRELLALAPFVTPNLGEAAELASCDADELARDLGARERAARRLLERGARAVVLKGGHGPEDPVVDLLVEPERPALRLEHPRTPGGGIRGSGCRHASALAAGLARGLALEPAARAAARYVAARIALAARA